MPEDIRAVDYTGIMDDYAPSEEMEQSEEMDLLVKNINDNFTNAYEARLPYERDWELYRLYLKGEQLIVRHRDTGEIVRLTSEDSKRLRSVHNALRPTARSLIGKLTRSIPTIKVLPATADVAEQHGARAADALLQYARRKEDLDLRYLEANEYLPWAGNSFVQLSWDRHGGATLAYCQVCTFNTPDMEAVDGPCPRCTAQREMEQETQRLQHETQQMEQMGQMAEMGMEPDPEMLPPSEPPPMEQGGPLPMDLEPPTLVEANEGDFRVYTRDTRDLYIEPGASSILQTAWVILRTAAQVSQVRREFPEHSHHIKAQDNIYSDRTAELRFNSVDSYGEIEYLKDHVYVYEVHEKPTEMYPKGRVIYMVNDKIVRLLEESPYHVLGRFPFYHFGFDRNNGEFWFEPFCAQAWHRQREINQIETQIREHVELVLKPKLLNPIGSRISQDEFTATSAQIIKYNAAAGDPRFVPFPPLPAQVFDRRNELVADVRLQASVTEQEAGVNVNDPSGRAMAIIEAEADQQIGPILMRNHAEWREMHRGILILFQAYAHPDKKWSVPGPEGIQMFSFDELNLLQPGYDVNMEQTDGMSRNPAVRLQQTLDLLNAGVFTDPMTGMPDMKAFMRQAKLNMPNAGYDIEATERAAASQVPYKLKKGIQHIPQMWDDPMIFAEEMLAWLRGPGRREDPQIQMQVGIIWQFYMTWAVSQMPPEGLGMPMQGTGQQQGPGSGPGGPDQTAMGGSANGPGNMGTDIRGQAAGQIQQADQQGENLARV